MAGFFGVSWHSPKIISKGHLIQTSWPTVPKRISRQNTDTLFVHKNRIPMNYVYPFTALPSLPVIRFSILGFLLFVALPARATLICPDDTTVPVDPCDHVFILNYDSLDWSSTVPLMDTLFSPAQGAVLSGGQYIVSITGLDENGELDVCNFILTVVGSPTAPACDDHLTVTLEDDCFPTISPLDVLEPFGLYCEEEYQLTLHTQLGQVIASGPTIQVDVSMIGQPFTLTVQNVMTSQTCWSTLEVTTPTFFRIACPSDTTITCVAPADPQFLGMPQVQSCVEAGQISITYKDAFVEKHCPDTLDYVITRTWTATNNFGESVQCEQIIKARRYSLDEVDFPPDYDGTDQPPLPCQAGVSYSVLTDSGALGVPTVGGYPADKATCDFSVFMEDSVKNICGESYEIMRRWRVFDFCDNQFKDHIQTILITDNEPPVFEVPDTVFVSSAPDCGNEMMLPQAVILDECSSVDFEVKTPWETLSQNGGPAFVVLSNGTYPLVYTLTDACGNAAVKSVVLVVAPPALLACPNDVTIDCETYFNDLEGPLAQGNVGVLSGYGSPEFASNCAPVFTESVQNNVNACGQGTLVRTIETANFSNPETCVQNIHVQHHSDFVATFPADETYVCTGQTLPDFGAPEVVGADCEHIEITYTDEIFNVVPDACFKIVRTWRVVNTCLFDSTQNNVVVESPESALPAANCDLNGDGNCSSRTFQDGLNAANFPNAAPDGVIEYAQTIKITDSFAPEFAPFNLDPVCVEGNNCAAFVTLPMPDVLDCSEVSMTVTSDLGVGAGPFPNVSPGTYSVTYQAVDNCGNSSAITRDLVVFDCTLPEAVCKTGITVTLLNTTFPPELTVYASDLDAGSFDNCSANLQFAFSEDPADIARTLTCDDLGTTTLYMYVMDEVGNTDFCASFINVVTSGSNDCDPPTTISGNILKTDQKGVGQVTVFFETPAGLDSVMTDNNGHYVIQAPGPIMNIQPYKNINLTNGVTTYDIVLIQKHILGVQPFTAPYQFIAADINRSSSITVYDAVIMKKAILFLINEFPNNTSWRFQPTANPYDWTGIKIGDVNLSADPLNLNASDDRAHERPIALVAADLPFSAGQRLEMELRAGDTDWGGGQFTLDFDPEALSFRGFLPGKLMAADMGTLFSDEGQLTFSWINEGELLPGAPLATLIFEAKTTGTLSRFVRMTGSRTPREAFDQRGHFRTPVLRFEQVANDQHSRVGAPSPNPFSDQTRFEVFLPEAGSVSIQVFRADGLMVYSARNFLSKGYNYLMINDFYLSGKGIY
ncbi:MAG: hypothetical protein D6714_11450, partial [Bacteroidetes bacterium]